MKQSQSQDKKANRPSAIWPQDEQKNKGVGTTKTNNSNTRAELDPEINAPIYDPETTKKKMPVMDEDIKADNQG